MTPSAELSPQIEQFPLDLRLPVLLRLLPVPAENRSPHLSEDLLAGLLSVALAVPLWSFLGCLNITLHTVSCKLFTRLLAKMNYLLAL